MPGSGALTSPSAFTLDGSRLRQLPISQTGCIRSAGTGLAFTVLALVMLVAATVIGGLMASRRRDAGFLFVLVWSFVGIALKQVAAPLVAYSAWIVALISLVLAIYSIIQRRRIPRGYFLDRPDAVRKTTDSD